MRTFIEFSLFKCTYKNLEKINSLLPLVMSQKNFDAKQIYQLILNLKSRNPQERDESIKMIPTIASCLGIERTILELIPYIINSAAHTEKSLSDSIKQFSNFDFDYTQNHFKPIFDAIKPLFEIDINAIRKATVNFLATICSKLDQSFVEEYLPREITLLLENNPDEYSFPISLQLVGAKLIGKIFHLLSKDYQNNILTDFITFAGGENPPLVECAIIKTCTKLIQYTGDPRLFKIVQKYTKNPSPTIAYPIPKFIIRYLSKENSDFSKIVVLLRGLSRSPNWRIKCKLFISLKPINDIKPIPSDLLVDIFYGTLNRENEDPEVRIAEAQQLGLLQSLIDSNPKTMEIIQKLLKDDSPHVRTATIESISQFEDREFVKNQITSLLKDEVREVRTAAIDSLRTLDIPNEEVSSIISDFLHEKIEWRERNDIANLFVSRQLHDLELFKQLIFDDAYQVRKTMVTNISLLKFDEAGLFDIVKEAISNEDYQIRQVGILIIIVANLFKNEEGIKILQTMMKDEVSNVRLIIAKYTPRHLHLALQLINDPDEDVCDAASSQCATFT